jgi:hypothetical protein
VTLFIYYVVCFCPENEGIEKHYMSCVRRLFGKPTPDLTGGSG